MQGIKQFLINAALDLRAYLALVSAILAYIAYRRHRRKCLVYMILSNASLFSVNHEVKDRVKILLDDKPVEDVNLVIIRVANTGNDPIASKDFETPISLNFGDNATILSAEVAEKKPKDLPAQITYDGTTVKIEPMLLNAKDALTIKALVAKANDALTISVRIAGVNEIENRTDKIKASPFMLTVTISVFLGLVGVFLVISSQLVNIIAGTTESNRQIAFTIGEIVIIVALAFFLLGRWRH